MGIPTAAEIEAIRKRVRKSDERDHDGSTVPCGCDCTVCAADEMAIDDRETLLSALDAVTAERDKYKQLAAAFIAMG